jgi:hypothetical protein
MQTLSYGYQIPGDGEKGPTVFPALNGNIQQINDHNHDGENSAPISAAAVGSKQIQIPAAQWASYPNAPVGFYRQVVAMAPGFAFDTKNVQIRTAAGVYLYPTLEKIDNNSFFIYSTDPTLNLVANYGG